MSVSVGLLGCAHVHAGSYARLLGPAQLAGVYDAQPARAQAFASEHGVSALGMNELLAVCQAVIICSENSAHLELITQAAEAKKAILCEKPVSLTKEEGDAIASVVATAGVLFMPAFPCAYAPAWGRAKARLSAGEIGAVVSVCATNHGRFPGDWFGDASLGGGAIFDHVVHVANLLADVFDAAPIAVSAATSHRMQNLPVEDAAMVTIDYADGRFATLDSSWSRPANYRTWGNVTLNIVGTEGVIEVDLFAQEIEVYGETHRAAGYGSNLDALMLTDFLSAVQNGTNPKLSLQDALDADRYVWAAKASQSAGGERVALGTV